MFGSFRNVQHFCLICLPKICSEKSCLHNLHLHKILLPQIELLISLQNFVETLLKVVVTAKTDDLNYSKKSEIRSSS